MRQPITSPYRRLAEAADYVRFSVRQFKRYVERDSIPTCGPGGKLYLKADLDAWVENPAAFKKSVQHRPNRRLGQFTPVSV